MDEDSSEASPGPVVNDLDPVLLKPPAAAEGEASPEPAGGSGNKDLWLCSRSDLNMLSQVGPGGQRRSAVNSRHIFCFISAQ